MWYATSLVYEIVTYRQTSNISRTKSQNLTVSRIVMQLSAQSIQWSRVLTHCGLADLRKWAILTAYWRHQSFGYLKKIRMPVVNIHWCPWTLKSFNIQLLMSIIKC